jgi:simple sugar transport system ATP-binding protein
MALTPIVEMRNIYKSFGAVRALHGVDLELYPQEILGLVGDNAAGKSTLAKILSGAIPPDRGEIYFDGKPVHFQNPREARHQGIEMVYQDFAVCGNLDMSDNVFLGRWPSRPILGGLFHVVQDGSMARRTVDLIGRLRIDINSPRTLVETLSGGQRQAVAIARAMAFEARVIIMDEPTASISVKAIGELLHLMEDLKAQGVSIIIITHRLQDVIQTADRVMVLRSGQRVDCKRVADTNLDEIINLIVRGKPAPAGPTEA